MAILSVVSLLAIVAIATALTVAWTRRFLATGALAICNLFVFAIDALGPQVVDPRFGAISVVKNELALWTPNLGSDPVMGALQLITAMFVHADLFHLIGNLVVLLGFALPFEERIGARRFLLIYMLGGIMGTLIHVGGTLGAEALVMGASGAIFAVIGAFAASFPNLVVPLPLPLLFIMIFVRMRVWVAAFVFALINVVSYFGAGENDPTAYLAHLGGLVGGIFLGLTLVRGSGVTARRQVAVDLEALAPFARDAATGHVLQQMRANHDEPQIFQAWLDRFFRTARCPTCQHKVMPRHQGEVVCTQGHRFDVRKDRAAVPVQA